MAGRAVAARDTVRGVQGDGRLRVPARPMGARGMRERICECGPAARGPFHGYCGRCGNFIRHVSLERDLRWRAAMDVATTITWVRGGDGRSGAVQATFCDNRG